MAEATSPSPAGVLVLYHKKGCPACEPFVGPSGTLSKLARVDVLEVEAAHPFAIESEEKWGVPIEFYPTLVLALSRRAFAYPRDGQRDTKSLQAWIDERLRATSNESCGAAPEPSPAQGAEPEASQGPP